MPECFSPQQLQKQLQPFTDAKRWLVGYSGGLDSTALLQALVRGCQHDDFKKPILAVHINHGLSPKADAWQKHCEAFTSKLEIPFHAERVSVANHGKGLEDAARCARYEVFSSLMKRGDVLLLAHQLDDQAETLLFRMLRGAGPRGMSGMPLSRSFNDGHLLRPLLSFSRKQLESYVRSEGLNWIEDDSNQNEGFDRNFLRRQVMPLLGQRWPSFQHRWQQSAQLCREADELNQDLASIDLGSCGERKERLGFSLSLPSLKQLSLARRNNVLRHWLALHSSSVPDREHLAQIDQQMINGSSPEAAITWGSCGVRGYQGRIVLLPQESLQAFEESKGANELEWLEPTNPIRLPDGSRLEARRAFGQGLRYTGQALAITWRRGGERCHPADRGHSQTLKKLLQEYELEPWLRSRVPLICSDGEIVAVGDLWVCQDFIAVGEEEGLSIKWGFPE